METINRFNPLARRRDARRTTPGALASYRVLTLAAWAAAVAVSVWYTWRWTPAVHHGHWHWQRHQTFADQNRWHPSGFSLNMVMVDVYWAVLFVVQAGFVSRLFGETAADATAETALSALAVGDHFIANNVLHVVWALLFVRGHLVLAELVLVANLLNLAALYAAHPAAAHPLARVHLPAVAGPLAWTGLALFWNGAMAVPHAHGLVARVLANVFVWSILGFGLLFVLLGDFAMGFCLTVLTAALGVGQFLRQVIALQWIFAFTIMAVLFLTTTALAVPAWTGRGRSLVVIVTGDPERAPLLNDEQAN